MSIAIKFEPRDVAAPNFDSNDPREQGNPVELKLTFLAQLWPKSVETTIFQFLVKCRDGLPPFLLVQESIFWPTPNDFLGSWTLEKAF